MTGRVEELLDFGKRDDLVEVLLNLAPGHAQHRAVEVDILASGQFGVKTRADFQQRADPPVNVGVAGGRLGDARENFQQRAFARAVATDDAEHFAVLDLERYVFERPEGFTTRIRPSLG